ncbi:unnamed protein product, partial [Amoebophrya sp. A120]|eukprot:GSA120T00004569001.1
MPRLTPGRKAVGAGQDYLRIGPQCHRPDMHKLNILESCRLFARRQPAGPLARFPRLWALCAGSNCKGHRGRTEAARWPRGGPEGAREVRASLCMKRPQKNQPRTGRIRVFLP